MYVRQKNIQICLTNYNSWLKYYVVQDFKLKRLPCFRAQPPCAVHLKTSWPWHYLNLSSNDTKTRSFPLDSPGTSVDLMSITLLDIVSILSAYNMNHTGTLSMFIQKIILACFFIWIPFTTFIQKDQVLLFIMKEIYIRILMHGGGSQEIYNSPSKAASLLKNSLYARRTRPMSH